MKKNNAKPLEKDLQWWYKRICLILMKWRSYILSEIKPQCMSIKRKLLALHYSCGLLTATIEYSSLSVCLCVCLSVCVHDNSKNNGSIDLKLEHTVVYENSSDEFDIGHCTIKVEVMAWLWNFSPFTTIQIVKAHISGLA